MAEDDPLFSAPTPLHGRTAELARANLWTPWFGYSAATVYGDVVEESVALASGCAIADFTPYPVYEIAGSDASAYLDRLLTRPASTMREGEEKPALICESSGHVVALCTVIRPAPEIFLLMCASEVGARLIDARAGMNVEVSRTPLVPIALFGPKRDELLSDLGLNQALDGEGFVTGIEHNGVSLLVLDLPGQTAPGGGGSFVFMRSEDGSVEWDRLMRRGRDLSMLPVGLEALDRRRIDTGIPREGFEFRSAPFAVSDDERALPAEIGMGKMVELDGRSFTGAQALAGAVPRRELVRVEVDRVMPLKGQALRLADKAIGTVTSAYRAEALGMTKGLALVNKNTPRTALTVGPRGSVIPAFAAPIEFS
jgi:aminomethyltransferase